MVEKNVRFWPKSPFLSETIQNVSHSYWRPSLCLAKFRTFVVWAEPDPKTAFSRFYGTFRLSCAQTTGNSFTPNQWYRWKAETLEVCLLLVWRVCGQAFGRYRPLKGAEKWSCDHHENWKFARRKVHWHQKCYSFRSMTKNNEVIAGKPFQNSGVTRRLAVLNWRSSSIHLSSYYAPAPRRGIKRWCCLTSGVWRLSIWRMSVAYIWPKSRGLGRLKLAQR